jgi:hypothetical protein
MRAGSTAMVGRHSHFLALVRMAANRGINGPVLR